MEDRSENGVLEEFRIEFLDCWGRLPNKGVFFGLLVAWLGLFHLLGNPTLGYFPTPSLLLWMYGVFTAGSKNLLEADGAYGLAVPFVVLVLFWLKRRKLMALPVKAWWPGVLLVVAGLGLHMLGYMVQQPRISIAGMVVGLYGIMGLSWGPAWLRSNVFPFFLLLFLIPVGSLTDLITFPLRLIVSHLVTIISHFILAIDVEQQGNLLIDPTGRFQYEVAAACSGIRSLSAVLLLGVVLGFVSFQKPWKRLIMVFAAFPLAILGNLLRMLAIIIAADQWGQKTGNWVHDGGPFGLFSFLPYIPAFAGLLALEYYLRERSASPALPPGEGQRA